MCRQAPTEGRGILPAASQVDLLHRLLVALLKLSVQGDVLVDGQRPPAEVRNTWEANKIMNKITAGDLIPGRVFLTFSGDPSTPYRVVKVIRADGQSLWVKLYHDMFSTKPAFDKAANSTILNISVDTFFAWVPANFAVEHLLSDPVDADELEGCVDDGTNVLDYTRVEH